MTITSVSVESLPLPGWRVARGLPVAETAFGDWLKATREAKGWTTQVLADKAGLTQPYVTMLEQGTRNPRRDKVEQLAAAMEVDPAPGLLAAGFSSTPSQEVVLQSGKIVRLYRPDGKPIKITEELLKRLEFEAELAEGRGEEL
jgi:transcriptional regulator with XRE-family HTH domain